MTEADKKLLIEFDYGRISRDVFLKRLSVDIKNNPDFVKNEIKTAIEHGDIEEVQMTISLIWLSGDISKFTDLLNELLINPNHRSHQQIAKTLQDQDTPSPTTVPFVKKVLETNFDYLEYTCSESGAIAKWFSWLLYAIGTSEAIDLMKEYSNSKNKGIANEMQYRLNKLNSDSSS